MTDTTPRRKLAAILAADVFGYSKMMGENENRTLKNLKACRAITDESITNNHGRIFHTAGDSVIAEFASPVDAVVAAVEFQRILKARNLACETADQMMFRVGLNLGDVIVEGENLYGEGINIAARLEGIAAPGGICVAQNVFTEVRKKLDGIGFQSRGAQSLKNIEHPIDVYDIKVGLSVDVPEKTAQANAKRHAVDAKPLVSIFPIKVAGGDESVELLAVGLADTIASTLMKSSALQVIRADGSKVSDKSASNQENTFEFNITGTIQAAGKRLRIFMTLEDAHTGAQLWSKRYDETNDDVFEVQDKISSDLIRRVRWSIKEAIFERLQGTDNADLSVGELLDKAAGYMVRHLRQHIDLALLATEMALSMEPSNSTALSVKALCHFWLSDVTPFADFSSQVDGVLDLLDQSIAIDSRNYYALGLKADLLGQRGDFKNSLRFAKQALMLNPNLIEALSAKSFADLQLKSNESNVQDASKYMVSPVQRHKRALAFFCADMTEDALPIAEELLDDMLDVGYLALVGAAIVCSLQAEGGSHPGVLRFKARYPTLSLENCRRPIFFNPQVTERFDTGLQRIWA